MSVMLSVPVIFAVVPSNLRTPPAISIDTPKSNLITSQKSQTSFCSSLQHKTQKNPWNAMGGFLLAQCMESHKQPAQLYYEAARDLDMLPGRPNSIMNQALLKTDLPLVFVDPNQDNFHDSCHLTDLGYRDLAAQFSREILLQWKFSSMNP